jgi:hypothetical protein
VEVAGPDHLVVTPAFPVAIVAVLCLAIWIGGMFVAARDPRRDIGATTKTLPQHPADQEEPQRKAA